MHPIIFDRELLRIKKARAVKNFCGDKIDFLVPDIIERVLGSNLELIKEGSSILIVGCQGGYVLQYIKEHYGEKFLLTQMDLSLALIKLAAGDVVADEELLPFAESSFDVIIAIGSLHWINDLPGCFVQMFDILKDDGTIIGNVFGPKTLEELRHALVETEFSKGKPFSPRVSPFIPIKDVGKLLQRTRFKNVVVETDDITINYQDPLRLLYDLRNMGETNILMESNKGFLGKEFPEKLREIYLQHHSCEGCAVATIEVNTFIARKIVA